MKIQNEYCAHRMSPCIIALMILICRLMARAITNHHLFFSFSFLKFSLSLFHFVIIISCCELGHQEALATWYYTHYLLSSIFLHARASISLPFFTLCPLTCAGGDNFLAFLSAQLE